MYEFGLFGYLIIALTILLCMIVVLYFERRIQNSSNLSYRKYGIILVIFGSALSLISITFHIIFQRDISNTPELIRLISDMTAKPAIIFTILGFIFGLSTIFIGVLYMRKRVKNFSVVS